MWQAYILYVLKATPLILVQKHSRHCSSVSVMNILFTVLKGLRATDIFNDIGMLFDDLEWALATLLLLYVGFQPV